MARRSKKDWLDGRTIQCRKCGHALWWVLHSGFYGGYFLYCTSCPRRLELSVYESTFRCYEDAQRAGYWPSRDEMTAAVEAALENCPCGGRFTFCARRRCLYCSAVLPPRDHADRDVWPARQDSAEWDQTLHYSDALVRKDNDVNLLLDKPPWKPGVPSEDLRAIADAAVLERKRWHKLSDEDKLREIEEKLRGAPYDGSLLRDRVELLMILHRESEAAALHEALHDPDDREKLATCYHALGRYSEAAAILGSLYLKGHILTMRGEPLLPRCHFQLGEVDAALAWSRRILRRVEYEEDYCLEISRMLIEFGQAKEALRVLQRGLKKKPDNFELLEQSAIASFHCGKFQRAARIYTDLAAAHENPHLEFWAAMSWARARRRKQAVTHLQRAVELDPGNEQYANALRQLTAS